MPPDAPQNLPVHVAIIMDGNGRWARARGLSRTRGHQEGAESARAIAEACVELGIPYLTLYAFSTENWDRPAAEVRFLMTELRRFLIDRRQELLENGIRLRAIGRTEQLPPAVRQALAATEKATRDCENLTLLLALSYGGRCEIADACRAIAQRVQAGELRPEDIDEHDVARYLYTVGIPDPDLLIRTGGEMRLSNFLLWQVSYAEIYVTDVLWPDFRKEQFQEALRDFAARERRFGGVDSDAGAPTAQPGHES